MGRPCLAMLLAAAGGQHWTVLLTSNPHITDRYQLLISCVVAVITMDLNTHAEGGLASAPSPVQRTVPMPKQIDKSAKPQISRRP